MTGATNSRPGPAPVRARDGELALTPAGSGEPVEDAVPIAPEQAGEWMARLQADALRLLSEVGHPPRALRLSVGEVRFDLEWQTPAAPALNATAPAPADAPAPPAADPRPAVPAPPDGHQVRSPSVGVFYRSSQPGAAPFVESGDHVSAGQQVGIVEVMKLMIPVEADRAGEVLLVLKDNGDSVEYDEPLLTLAGEA